MRTFPERTDIWLSSDAHDTSAVIARFASGFQKPRFSPEVLERLACQLYGGDPSDISDGTAPSYCSAPWSLHRFMSPDDHPWRFCGNEDRRRAFGDCILQDIRSSKQHDEPHAVGAKLRERTSAWWKQLYCAGRMQLCVVGRGDTQEKLEDTLTPQEATMSHYIKLITSHFNLIPARGYASMPQTVDSVHPITPVAINVCPSCLCYFVLPDICSISFMSRMIWTHTENPILLS